MPTPSLLIVPARFKTGKLYSQIPTSGAGDFTVTRNTEARRFDSAGLVASVASGIPRLDYYTSGGVTGCPALLVEPSAQNLALQSADFNTTWIKINLNVSTNATPDPAGGNTADLLTVISGSTQAELSQVITTVSGTAYVFSFFGKKGSGATDLNSFRVISSNVTTVTINWDTGVLTQTGTPSSGATAQNFGNGWWRISIPFTAGSTLTTVQVCSFTTFPAGQNSYRWGAQLELGSVATSYIPTTTGSVTRAADVISVSGAVSGSIGQSEGTIYAEVDLRNIADTKTIIQSDDGTADNRLILFVGTAPNRIQFLTVASGTNSVVSGSIATGINKIAASYFSGSVQLYLNGSFLASGTPTAFPTVTRNNFSLGTRISAGVYGAQFNDRIRAAALYTTRLTNAELATLTTP